MMGDGNLYGLLSPVAALVAGLVVSLHCVGMCGPLSCSLIGQTKGASALPSHGIYQLGRLVSYTILGAIAGGVGERVVSWLGESPTRFAPWAMAVFFVALALNLDGLVTRWQAKLGIGRSIVRKAYQIPGYMRGLSLGLLTPLIPCGPLYMMLWATTLSGSALNGAVVMSCFALGTAPLMLLAQSGWSWLSLRMDTKKLSYIRRTLALLAVGLLCMRAFVDIDAASVVSGEGVCK